MVTGLLLGGAPLTASQELQVHCRGEGPAVYLIGGGPAFTTWHLTPIQEHLGAEHRVCRWDMRGVGENADLPLAPDVPALSQWLADMARVLPDEPVALWGHSWGALQALLFAERHPRRVRTLVLSNPVDPTLRSLEGIEQKRPDHPDPGGGPRLEDMGTPAEALHALRRKLAGYFVDPAQGWDYARRFTRADTDGRLNLRIWAEYRAVPLSDEDLRALAGKVAGIVYCRQDVLQPEARAEYRRLLPGVEHVVLEACGHFPWVERPQRYLGTLSRLLARG